MISLARDCLIIDVVYMIITYRTNIIRLVTWSIGDISASDY